VSAAQQPAVAAAATQQPQYGGYAQSYAQPAAAATQQQQYAAYAQQGAAATQPGAAATQQQQYAAYAQPGAAATQQQPPQGYAQHPAVQQGNYTSAY
jgi:hypothetical protein